MLGTGRLTWLYRRLRRAARPLRLYPQKARTLKQYQGWRHPLAAAEWLIFGSELDNFTYEIANTDELAAFVSRNLGVPVDSARRMLAELAQDNELRDSLDTRLSARDRRRRAHYGRRAGWYTIIRLAKPALVVETGVHDGLGSAIMLRALERNAEEGHDGRLVSFDVAAACGWLVDERLSRRWRFNVVESRDDFSTALAGTTIGVFLHDSDHSYDHETFELETVLPLMLDGGVILSDNADGTAFPDFCDRHNLRGDVFYERPSKHFYPGATIGVTRVPTR